VNARNSAYDDDADTEQLLRRKKALSRHHKWRLYGVDAPDDGVPSC
jgi:hypothetical protein